MPPILRPEAMRRLADEYDAAQARGEVVGPKRGGDSTVQVRNAATSKDAGFRKHREIHEACQLRNAEKVVRYEKPANLTLLTLPSIPNISHKLQRPASSLRSTQPRATGACVTRAVRGRRASHSRRPRPQS